LVLPGFKKLAKALPMSSEIAIKVEALSKCYQIYEQPRDRLKQFVLPRLLQLAGAPPKQYFREFWALKDVSFSVKKGETVGIVGRNGSGKSTLLQLICGTLNPTAGSVKTSGRIAALLELGSGFNLEFTGRENVYMNGAVLGLSRSEIDSRFNSIAAFADIGDFIDQPVKTYSSGMLVRLAFSVAINVEPDILVVDEALSVGDELFQRKCFSRIAAIRERGATILFVSHSGGQIVELCDRAILIDAGEKLTTGIPKRVVGSYQKLLYAATEKREAIREEISQNVADTVELLNSAGNMPRSEGSQVKDTDGEKESFDLGLISNSAIEYESSGAYIKNPGIFDSNGNQVNVLIGGRTYRYAYKVTFTEGVENVLFGLLIKTISGVELGGASSAPSIKKGIPTIRPGSEYMVDFHFQCNLNPGIYFINAGVFGVINNEEKYLHRILDAFSFRVMPNSEQTSSGFVNFNCSPEIYSMNTSVG
jgi:lipopolysaccharide transport system ATP-binding protein